MTKSALNGILQSSYSRDSRRQDRVLARDAEYQTLRQQIAELGVAGRMDEVANLEQRRNARVNELLGA